ncbi:unnamed protein product, partial [Ectocarpus sp. 4 AP-2014]
MHLRVGFFALKLSSKFPASFVDSMSSLLPALASFKCGCPLHFRRSDGDDVMMSAGAGRRQRQRQRQQRHVNITAGKTPWCSSFSLFRIRSLAVRRLTFALPPSDLAFSNRRLAFRRRRPHFLALRTPAVSTEDVHRTTSPTATRPERKRHARSDIYESMVPRKQPRSQTTEEQNHTM